MMSGVKSGRCLDVPMGGRLLVISGCVSGVKKQPQ